MYVMSLFQNIISKIPQSNFTFKKKNLKMYMQKTLIVTFFLLKIVDKEKKYNYKKAAMLQFKKIQYLYQYLNIILRDKNTLHRKKCLLN